MKNINKKTSSNFQVQLMSQTHMVQDTSCLLIS